MSKYPKVNYIGNKEKIADWIIECLPIRKGVVLDLFSGGCSVSYALKKSGFEVITNDVLYSNYCISKAIIENSEEHLQLTIDEESLKKYYSQEVYERIRWLENKLYFSKEIRELSSLISFSETLEGANKFLFLALLRRAMIRKIPYSRMNIKWEEIVKLRDEEWSYKKYKRRRAYHNKSFLFHILDNLGEYNSSVIKNKLNNKAYQKDAFEVLKCIDKKIDLVYIDPPYPSTMNKYKEFYGAFDVIFEKEIDYIDFTNKAKFLDNLINLLEKVKEKTKYIAISLNNKSKPSYIDIVQGLENKVSNIYINKKEHSYKVTGKENKNSNYEVLIVVEV